MCDELAPRCVQVVAHSSETELKGSLVRLVQRLMHVATTFTGDGKNDVRALEQADVSFAFPTEPPAQGGQSAPSSADGGDGGAPEPSATAILHHDPEVAAAASTVVSGRFWLTWGLGHTERDSLANWGAVLWTRVYITTVLLLLKQGLTAGVNVSAAASTGMTENRDPYLPVMCVACAAVALSLCGHASAARHPLLPHPSMMPPRPL